MYAATLHFADVRAQHEVAHRYSVVVIPLVNDGQVRRARMHSLMLGEDGVRTPLEVATWFGAMQAQDAASGHWSLGIRCGGATEGEVLDAFERRELLRTWPMRGTIHIVPAADVRWMLEVAGVRALAGVGRRRAQLGLTERDIERATDVLAAALRDQGLLTRAEAIDIMAAAEIDVTGQRSYHLLWHAANVGVICIGPQRGSDQTFALLSAFAPVQARLTREEGLAELLLRFVRGHGPVGLRDFAGWSGLTLTDARTAASLNDGRLVPLRTNHGEMWATEVIARRIMRNELPPLPLVIPPGFDEFMLGYKDRTLQVLEGAMDHIVPGGNGMFRATVAIDGIAVATWKRTLRAKRVSVDVELFRRLGMKQQTQMHAAFGRYASYLGRDLELRVTTS